MTKARTISGRFGKASTAIAHRLGDWREWRGHGMRDLPIMCELIPDEITARRTALLPGLLAQAAERMPVAHGFRCGLPPQASSSPPRLRR
jgi:hypothetical protein